LSYPLSVVGPHPMTDSIDSRQLKHILQPLALQDWQAFGSRLRRLASDENQWQLLSTFLPYLVSSLAETSEVERVLVNFERFADGALDRTALFEILAETPRAVEILVKLFASSQFLTEILLHRPEYFNSLREQKRLARKQNPEQYHQIAQTLTGNCETYEEKLDTLRRFQRKELLRIGTCDLLDLYDVAEATRQLSHLAIGILRSCYKIVCGECEKGEKNFIIVGMGKLGGKELNYSSDIDLLFLTTNDSHAYQRVGEQLIDALNRVTSEGFLYRVDMRLRPWGQVGPLVPTTSGFHRYLNEHARLWEKQALLKARVIAGNRPAGNEFLRRAKTLLFHTPAETLRTQVFSMKQLTESYLISTGRKWGEIKLGEGSIRDIEFTTQYLQMLHGKNTPDILNRNTLKALSKLLNHHIISVDAYRILADGYTFFRTIEHHLQLMHNRQTQTLPSDMEAIAQLARRLGFLEIDAGNEFLSQYEHHRTAIRSVYLNFMGKTPVNDPNNSTNQSEEPPPGVRSHIDRMLPSYSDTFSKQTIAHHAQLVKHLSSSNLVEVDAIPLDNNFWQLTIVGFDFPGELALICGLLFTYGLNILKGDVFTYKPIVDTSQSKKYRDTHRKIVDVFTVNSARGETIQSGLWSAYARDLSELLEMTRIGQHREARTRLAKRVATSLQDSAHTMPDSPPLTLLPIEIEIDNQSSDQYSLLHIGAQDTPGFLYELSNAMAFNQIYIARVIADSVGSQVHDILFVTDSSNKKITDPDRQRELSAATVLIKHFTHLLPYSPNPESALLHFRGFIAELFKHPNWPDELASLEQPKVLHALARLLGVSDFLWDDFLRMQYTNLYPIIRDVDKLRSAKSRQQLQEEMEEILRKVHNGPHIPQENDPWQEELNAFKDREMFRVDMRHILGHTTEFWDFAQELTDLVEVVINATLHLCHEDLRVIHGTPYTETGQINEISVCALGKCGGHEMGFASDIELMFIYSGNGSTGGPAVISSAEFYEKLVSSFVSAIHARREGIFEIDLQLRPYGKAGSLAVSLEAFQRYFHPEGPAWAYERQALVRLRPIAGNTNFGEQIVALRDDYVYTNEPFDTTSMRAMRERQIRHTVRGGTFHPKFSPGGLTDVEYLVQGLQITHGLQNPDLRQANTRRAMKMLAEYGFLSQDDYIRLRKAHTFLRWLIDSLRVVRGNAKDITIQPDDSEEYAFLTRRLNYGTDRERLRSEIARFTADIQDINSRLLD
jgi:[glutamine synthetase] adenylyltransferase / [glutamine synthetase]-adenylyl-L-tyrosine phosphorylase